jgi:hypothetical protein
LEFQVTRRFAKALDKSGTPDLIARSLRRLKTYLELQMNGKTPTQKPKNLDSIKGSDLKLHEYRIDIHGRIIFQMNPELLLVDFALTHTSVEAFMKLSKSEQVSILENRSDLPAVLQNREETSEEFDLNHFLNEDFSIAANYVEEYFPEWVHFLDEHQIDVRDKLLQNINGFQGFRVHLIIGGAGTGKTVVLTNLAFALEESGFSDIKFTVNPGVREYLKAGEREIPGLQNNNKIQVQFLENGRGIRLLDDPIDIANLVSAVVQARVSNVPIVVALDPVQWHQRRVAEKWDSFLRGYSPVIYSLTQNYRQHRGTGEPALEVVKHFLEKSSPFASYDKVATDRKMLAPARKTCLEDVTFVGTGGGWRLVESEFESSLQEELSLVNLDKSELKWPKLLTVAEPGIPLPDDLQVLLAAHLKKYGSVRTRNYNQVAEVRGTEYNTVFLFMRKGIWANFKIGKLGYGTTDWEYFNRILMFLTRARNRAVIFLLPN